MRRPAATLPILLGLLAIGATEVVADFRASFREGVRAVERRQWERAVSNLDEAIAANPASGETVLLYGRRFVRYLPYWYLGVAKYNLGDHRGAAEAWKRELDQGAIQGATSEYSELQSLWPRVEGLLARETPPAPPPTALSPAQLASEIQRAETALELASQAAAPVAEVTVRSGFAGVLAAEPQLQRDLEQADGRLRRAREGLDRGRREADLERLGEAAALADEARQAYAALLPRARQGLEAFEAAQRRERDRQLRAEEERVVAERRIAEDGPQAEGDASAARASVEAAETERARQAEALGGPPAELVQAARAYFAADYRRALELLGTFEGSESRARLQAHLFRAAADFTLYHLSPNPDSETLERVLEEILAVRALDPGFRPDPDLFSPRFIRFFDQAPG